MKKATFNPTLILPLCDIDSTRYYHEENIEKSDMKVTKQKRRIHTVVSIVFVLYFISSKIKTWSKSSSEDVAFSSRLLSLDQDESDMNNTTSFPTTINDNRTTATTHIIKDGAIVDSDSTGEDKGIPKITWLMSFPNSGTSYTLRAITKGSNVKVATNYGEHHLDERGYSVPIYQTYENGPYFTKGSIDIESKVLPPSVVTKTHCGSRCEFCHPREFIETRDSFKSRCFLSNGIKEEIVKDINKVQFYEEENSINQDFDRERDLEEYWRDVGYYNSSLVERAIHLFRDPFDNLVSRYHLHYKHKDKAGDESWLKSHPRSAEGFQAYCKDMFEHGQKIEDSTFFSVEWERFAQNVPCFADMYRYVQWHNLAFEVLENLGITSSTYILHYEDYNEDFEGTIDSLYSFLDLNQSSDIDEFHPSDYSQYYTENQRHHAKEFMRVFASNDTLKVLQKYL